MSTEKRGVLVTVDQTNSQEMVKLRRDATIFGRDKADIILDDSEVSSTHCQIQNINDVYHIFDMNSTNGTFVNKSRIVKARLKEGDIITIGGSSFRFQLEDENKVRHIPTLFRSGHRDDARSLSIVDSFIEDELRTTKINALRITITYSTGEKETVELSQKVVYIGRATSFGRFDQDPEISRKHLLIKLNDTGEVFVEDQGSTNGSYLNGKKLQGLHPVTSKDEVRVGSCRLNIAVS